MAVITYNYNNDKNKKLSAHFQVWEFASPSDYNGNYPENVLIDSSLIVLLEQVYSYFGCDRCDINSGYRTSACDKSVGGSGVGPHTYGMAADAYFYKNGKLIESRFIACYLQDVKAHGIGYCCGGNYYGTHIDVMPRIWHGDERNYDITVSDYYYYTNTTKAEMNSIKSNNTTNTTSGIKTSNLTASNKMINLIKTQEGLSLKACKAIPSEEYWTIGYGHYGAEVKANQTITESEAEQLLRQDLKVFEDTVNSAVKVKISQSQFDACVSLAYNIGTYAFANSDIVKFINDNKFGHACVDFPSWRKAGGQVLPGLVKRRQLEMEYFGLNNDFTLIENLNIRSGAGTSNSIRKVSQVTANGKKCVLDSNSNANAVFKKGTVITALELKAISNTVVEVWARCPSGWVCLRNGDEVYVD